MVRLVFRPYTQIWRSICTSESLRASTRVSSGFTLFRHSSPSFGSQHLRSYSNLSTEYPDRSVVPLTVPTWFYFHYAQGFVTRRLAHMLDSLVRVSRRVGYSYFVNIRRLDNVFNPPSHHRKTTLPEANPIMRDNQKDQAKKTTCDSSVPPVVADPRCKQHWALFPTVKTDVDLFQEQVHRPEIWTADYSKNKC